MAELRMVGNQRSLEMLDSQSKQLQKALIQLLHPNRVDTSDVEIEVKEYTLKWQEGVQVGSISFCTNLLHFHWSNFCILVISGESRGQNRTWPPSMWAMGFGPSLQQRQNIL